MNAMNADNLTSDINLLRIKTVSDWDDTETITEAIKHIRTKVFQEEQRISAELEFDGLDSGATHFVAYLNNRAVATARIREVEGNAVKIERLAVLPEARRQGIAKKLMHTALKTISEQHRSCAIVHAQYSIAPLYEQLGFQPVGDKFNEAGIVHLKMIKAIKLKAMN